MTQHSFNICFTSAFMLIRLVLHFAKTGIMLHNDTRNLYVKH